MKLRTQPVLLALAVFALVYLAAVGILNIHASSRRTQAFHSFEARCEDAAATLERRLASFCEVVQSAAAFAGRFEWMSPEPWRVFAQARRRTLEDLNLPPVALLNRVPKSGLEQFLRKVREEGQPDYAPSFYDGQTDTPHDDLFLVRFYAPWDGLTTVIGLDMGSEARRRAALEKARDSGQPTLAQDLSIFYGGKREPGTHLMVPVFRRGAAIATVEERRSALVAMVVAPIRMQWLREQLPPGLPNIACIHLLRDGDRSFSEVGLCLKDEPDAHADTLTLEHPVHFAGMTWRLQARSRMERLAPDLSRNYLRGLMGGAVTAMFLGLLALYLSTSARSSSEQRQEAKEQLGRTLQLAHVAALHYDFATGSLQWQNELPRLFGWARGEKISPQTLAASLHPDDRARILRELNATRTDGALLDTAARVVAPDGSVKTLAARGLLLRDAQENPAGLAGVVWDITARRKVAEAMMRAETQYRRLLDAMADAVLVIAEDGRIAAANPAACALFGFRDEAEGAEGATLESLLPEPQPGGGDTRAELERQWETARVRGRARVTLTLRRADSGARFTADLVLGVAPGAATPLRMVTLRDISAQATLELEMLEEERVRQRLSVAILDATYAEHKRLSAALHDEVCGPLEKLENELAQIAGEHDSGEVEERIAAADRSLAALLQATHALVYHLATPVFDRLGIAAALEDLCSRSHAPGRPERSFSLRGDPAALPQRTALFLFHAARELLANADLHARARTVRLVLRAGRRTVTLAVRDDGQGFSSPGASPDVSAAGGLGLFSIRQRIATLGGKFRLTSRPGRGTCALIRLSTPESTP